MAGELPPGKRRLARVGLTATIAAIGIGLSMLEPLPEEPSPEDESMLTSDEPEADSIDEPAEAEPPPVSPVVGTAAGSIAVAIMIGSSLLQKRWLARLARSGHAHPHRSLALRVAVISFAGTLPARLMEVHEVPVRKGEPGTR